MYLRVNTLGLYVIVVILYHTVESQICSFSYPRKVMTSVSYRQTYTATYKERCRYYGTCEKSRVLSRIAYRFTQRPTTITENRCCFGYEREFPDYDNGLSKPICKPVCEKGCRNGVCTRPNECTCNTGYVQNNWSGECQPVCRGGCKDGICQAPDVCTCFPGYTDSINGTCTPICTEPCHNALCVAPDTCSCLPGYSNTSDTLCQPYCSSGCYYGECIAPETCSCYEGYSNEQAHDDCLPVCDNCENGNCTAPNICVCLVGYDSIKNTCKPVCDGPCDRGHCSAPNTCTCEPGFRQNSSITCEPYCSTGCINGECISPESCSCNEGYINIHNICHPLCDDGTCLNGTCVAPDVCKCVSGYTLHGGLCVPECDRGYARVDNCESQCCEPVCDVDCEHGTCVGPDDCRCDDRFVRDDDEEKCVPCTCGHGTCIEPDICECDTGYKLNNNKTICEPVCPNCYGVCVAPYKCICKPPFVARNETIGGGDCDCFNCSSSSGRRCDRTTCSVLTSSATEESRHEYGDVVTFSTEALPPIHDVDKNIAEDALEVSTISETTSMNFPNNIFEKNYIMGYAEVSQKWYFTTWFYITLAIVALVVIIAATAIVMRRRTSSYLVRDNHVGAMEWSSRDLLE